MARALSSGWTCAKCGTQRIRTVVVDSARATDRVRAKGVQSKCPACGHAEFGELDAEDLVGSTLQYVRARIVDVYGPAAWEEAAQP